MNHAPLPSSEKAPRVLIVGAGPIGLELAVDLQRNRIPFEIVDAGPIGQTMNWWAPETRWFSSNERISIAGVPLLTKDQSKATREDYLNYLRGIATQFNIRVRTYEPVTEIRRSEQGFDVDTMPQQSLRSDHYDKIVLAIGGTDRPRRLNVPGEDLPHVDGYLREPHRYFGRRVLIVGGRNSAAEAALRLHHAGAEVCLSYRGPALPEEGIKYWLLPELKGLCSAGRITAHFGSEVVRITPQETELRSAQSNETFSVKADDVLTLIGYEQNKSLFRSAGVNLQESSQHPEFDLATMETNVPGIYVAGTAVAGTQNSRYKTFLENCHQHVDKIVAHITGQTAIAQDDQFQKQITAQPES